MTLWLRGGMVLDERGPYGADVVVAGERVEALGVVRPFGPYEEIDCRGLWLLPGGIDAHTHLEMDTGAARTADDFFTGSRAAALGGTTTVLDFANPDRGEPLVAALQRWRAAAAARIAVDHRFHVSVIDLGAGQLDELGALVAAGVGSLKVFTTYRGRMMLAEGDLRRVLRAAARHGLLTVVHAEDDALIGTLVARARAARRTAAIHHARTRPPRSEERAVRRVIELARAAGAALHVAHLSTAGAVDAVAAAQAAGADVSAETCPQYLWLDEALLARRDGRRYLCTPPLRTRRHRDRLWRGLREGTVGAAVTDHCPFADRDRDGHPGFSAVPSGLPGVGLRLPLLLEGVARGRLSPGRLLEVWAAGPARRFGLAPRKGRICPGADADIVAVDPLAAWTIGAEGAPPGVTNPYRGMRVRGAVRWVLRRGAWLVEDGVFGGEPGSGRYLPWTPAEARPATRRSRR